MKKESKRAASPKGPSRGVFSSFMSGSGSATSRKNAEAKAKAAEKERLDKLEKERAKYRAERLREIAEEEKKVEVRYGMRINPNPAVALKAPPAPPPLSADEAAARAKADEAASAAIPGQLDKYVEIVRNVSFFGEMGEEELEMAAAAHEMAEESRRHALYQSYASYGSEHPPEEYGAEETGDDYYHGGYANSMNEQHGEFGGATYSPAREQMPKWAKAPPSPPPPPQPQHAPPSPEERVPPGRLHQQQQQQQSQQQQPRARLQSPSGSESERRRSGFSPQLFEKGSFAHRKIDDVGRATAGETPLSGRGSNRSGRASMGAYADFAARMQGAESNRSSRSARSYRG